ncbi:MAG: EamA family transporter [Kiritimatiellia bacterium]
MTAGSAHLAAAFAGSAAAAAGQLCMKWAARKPAPNLAAMYLRPPMIAGYLLILASTVLNTWAYKLVPAKALAVFLPLNLLMVVLLSAAVLGERLTRRQWAGIALILAGTAGFA